MDNSFKKHELGSNVKVILDIKDEYINKFINITRERFKEGYQSIYDNVKENNKVPKLLLKEFQDKLKLVPLWSEKMIEDEFNRIKVVSKCDFLEQLIEALFSSYSQMFMLVNKKEVPIKIPSQHYVIHNCYIEIARALWKKPQLYYHRYDVKTRQSLNNELDILIYDSINTSIKELIPFKELLNNYLEQTDTTLDELNNLTISSNNQDEDDDEDDEISDIPDDYEVVNREDNVEEQQGDIEEVEEVEEIVENNDNVEEVVEVKGDVKEIVENSDEVVENNHNVEEVIENNNNVEEVIENNDNVEEVVENSDNVEEVEEVEEVVEDKDDVEEIEEVVEDKDDVEEIEEVVENNDNVEDKNDVEIIEQFEIDEDDEVSNKNLNDNQEDNKQENINDYYKIDSSDISDNNNLDNNNPNQKNIKEVNIVNKKEKKTNKTKKINNEKKIERYLGVNVGVNEFKRNKENIKRMLLHKSISNV